MKKYKVFRITLNNGKILEVTREEPEDVHTFVRGRWSSSDSLVTFFEHGIAVPYHAISLIEGVPGGPTLE